MSGYIGTQPVPQATQHCEAFTAQEALNKIDALEARLTALEGTV